MVRAFRLTLATALAATFFVTSSQAYAGAKKQASWAPDARRTMLTAMGEQGVPPDLSEIALRALLDTATGRKPAGRTDHGPYFVLTDGTAAVGRCTPVSVDIMRRDNAERVRFETVACHGHMDDYWRNEENSRIGGHITAAK